MSYFADKVAVVTGGASGIGQAVGEELARQGARVVLADLDARGGEESAEEIRRSGGRAQAMEVDVTRPEAVDHLIHHTVHENGRLDYLFNNAGTGIQGEVRDQSLEGWRRILKVNLEGVIHGVHAAYPVMVRQGFGHIVNTASLAGLTPAPGLAPYAATKHAVVGLTTSLRVEGADLGVRASVICPGVIETPLVHNIPTVDPALVGTNMDDYMGEFPLKPYPVKRCAQDVLRGVRKNRAIIVVTGHAKLLWMLWRLSPTLQLRLSRHLLAESRKRFPRPPE